MSRFQQHYPGWQFEYGLTATLTQIFEEQRRRKPVPVLYCG